MICTVRTHKRFTSQGNDFIIRKRNLQCPAILVDIDTEKSAFVSFLRENRVYRIVLRLQKNLAAVLSVKGKRIKYGLLPGSIFFHDNGSNDIDHLGDIRNFDEVTVPDYQIQKCGNPQSVLPGVSLL